MRYHLSVSAFDVMDQVHYVARIWEQEDLCSTAPREVYELTGSMRGRGEDSPTRWLRELLEHMREAQ